MVNGDTVSLQCTWQVGNIPLINTSLGIHSNFSEPLLAHFEFDSECLVQMGSGRSSRVVPSHQLIVRQGRTVVWPLFISLLAPFSKSHIPMHVSLVPVHYTLYIVQCTRCSALQEPYTYACQPRPCILYIVQCTRCKVQEPYTNMRVRRPCTRWSVSLGVHHFTRCLGVSSTYFMIMHIYICTVCTYIDLLIYWNQSVLSSVGHFTLCWFSLFLDFLYFLIGWLFIDCDSCTSCCWRYCSCCAGCAWGSCSCSCCACCAWGSCKLLYLLCLGCDLSSLLSLC